MPVDKFFDKFDRVGKAIILVAAVIGVAFSISNYLILNQLSPLATRIQSVEARQDRQGTVIADLATKEDVQNGFDNVGKRIDDLKDQISLIVSLNK